MTQGAQTRTYSYDQLGRLIKEKVLEFGSTGDPLVATTYAYDNAGTLCSGDPNAVCKRTDSQGVITTYSYDALNRLTGKIYSDGTPAVTYTYDQQGMVNGLNITNGKGRRTSMTDGSGQTAWSYNAAGNPLTVRKTINGTGAVTKDVSYTYNLNGSVASITYPSGRVVNYSYNNAFQPVSAVDTVNLVNYVLNAQYAPHYALSSALFGNDHGNGGTTLTQSFNNRLQPLQFRAFNSSRTVMDFNFDFVFGASTNNGSLERVLNNLNHNRDQSFTYDTLNRVKTAASGTLWCNTFNYDRYGNLVEKDLTCGAGEEILIPTDAATNRTIGNSYDNAGNLLNDSLNSYTYNAENKMLTANNGTVITSFKYDGDGVRVMKSDYRLYWTGMGTEVLAETFTSGGNKREYIYFAGKRVAVVDLSVSGNNCQGTPPNCARYYFYGDHLGSTNVLANTSGGTTVHEADYFPFGGERVVTSSSINPHYKFTGKEWDSEDSLNHFLFREYSPRLGRFMTVDPLAGDVRNPQSLNRYTYVLNNPTNLIDPLGLQCASARKGGGRYCTSAGSAGGYAWGAFLAGAYADLGGYAFCNLPGMCGIGQQQEARWDSIMTAGYDPALQRFTNDVTINYTFPSGTTDTIHFEGGASLEDVQAAFNWAANAVFGGIPGFAFQDQVDQVFAEMRRKRLQSIDGMRATVSVNDHAPEILATVGTAKWVVHPCSIGVWYGASAGAAVLGSAAASGPIYWQIGEALQPILVPAMAWANRLRPFSTGWLGRGMNYVGERVQGACN